MKGLKAFGSTEGCAMSAFGFTRSFYYEGENRGYWKLARIRERGKLRGVTLVPYDSVAAFVRSQMKAVDA